MNQARAEHSQLPSASEQQVRADASELVQLAQVHDISDLAFASAGRLRGHVAETADPFAPFAFQRAATDLLGAEVELPATAPCATRTSART